MSLHFIQDQFVSDYEPPHKMDSYWERGFRHFGTLFYRYNVSILDELPAIVMPLRICLEEYSHNKKQRKILRKNQDITTLIRPAMVDKEKEDLFFRHAVRFKDNKPSSIYDFISEQPGIVPCETKEVCVFDKDKLVAFSFLDIGKIAASSVYAAFDLDYSSRSLGVYTMLVEIDYCIERGFAFYYPGYAFHRPSFYDYKKKFRALEYYNWKGKWSPISD
ncbi:MAG: arginine-tRNA-protein transferase [Spirochaetota bacterium]